VLLSKVPGARRDVSQVAKLWGRDRYGRDAVCLLMGCAVSACLVNVYAIAWFSALRSVEELLDAMTKGTAYGRLWEDAQRRDTHDTIAQSVSG
jgi:hypothetical protein